MTGQALARTRAGTTARGRLFGFHRRTRDGRSGAAGGTLSSTGYEALFIPEGADWKLLFSRER